MKIVICDPVDENVVQHFEEADDFEIIEAFPDEEIDAELPEANFLIVRSGTTVNEARLQTGENLVGIVRAGVGLDNIDLEKAEEYGVQVENTPEASTNAVAELVVGHILAQFRSIPRADKNLKQGEWIKSELDGREIQDKTVGVIGFGRIGQRVGEILSAFGAEMLAFDEYIDDAQIKAGGGRPVELDEMIETADIISFHVPLTPETENMIDRAELSRMKNSAILVNCSRGGIINETALQEALEAGEIGGACLDTYTEEPPEQSALITNQATVTTPHLGASTGEAQERIAQLVIDKVESMS